MKNDIREHIDMFRNFNGKVDEALKTPCQTSGAIFDTKISDSEVEISVKIPFDLDLDEDEAKLLEANLHNALELVLRPYFHD